MLLAFEIWYSTHLLSQCLVRARRKYYLEIAFTASSCDKFACRINIVPPRPEAFFSYPDCKLLRETISRIILPFKKTACAQRFPENYSNGIMDDKFFVLRTIFHRQNVRFFSIHVFFSAPAENDYSELLFARVLHSKHFHSKLGKKQEKKSKKLCISSKTNDPDSEINQKTWSVRFWWRTTSRRRIVCSRRYNLPRLILMQKF